MASTNFTTHYSIPTPLGTDLTTPMDYNEAAEAVDTALFGAVTDAGNASIAAGNAVDTANAASDAVDTVAADLVQEKAKIVALQTRVTNAENEIDDVRADASDMITAYNEPTATSTHAYAIGDFFIYNNTLYKATAAIAIGATIVPDTNCETTNVSTELVEIKSALSDLTLINTFTPTTNETYESIMGRVCTYIRANFSATESCKLKLRILDRICDITFVSDTILRGGHVSGFGASIRLMAFDATNSAGSLIVNQIGNDGTITVTELTSQSATEIKLYR